MQDITEAQIFDFRQLWVKFRWGITTDIQKESDHFKILDFFPRVDAYLIPVNSSEIDIILNQFPTLSHFDRADQSLLTAAIREKGIVLTDDGDLLIECITLGIHAMSLPVFCLDLVKSGELSKREYYHLHVFWETHHRYAKKDLKRWKTQLQHL